MSNQSGIGTKNLRPAGIIPSDVIPLGAEVTSLSGTGQPLIIVYEGIDAYSRTITVTVTITYDIDDDPATFTRVITGDDAGDNPNKTWTVSWPGGKDNPPELVVT
jgi:hypothetical protein